MLNGIGTTLYGKTEIPGESAYIATKWFCILWLPIIPIRSYIVFSESGTNLVIWSSTEYQLTSLGYIYRPHLKAYIITALVFLLFYGLSFSGSGSDTARLPSNNIPTAALSANDEGLEYASNNQYREAVTSFSRAISYYESSAVIWHNRGLAHLELKAYQGAISDFTKSVDLDPGEIDIYLDRANAYLGLELYDRATDDYQESILRNDKSANVYYGLGVASYQLEKYQSALQALNKAVSIVPNDEDALTIRAYVFFALEQAEDALADAERALSINSNIPDAALLKAMLLDGKGYTINAIASYNHYLDIAPASELESIYFAKERILDLRR